MTLLPSDFFLQQVPGSADLVAFRYDFGVKALDDAQTVTVEENGDLTIEGYAAVFDGDDREGENFAPGAFDRATKAFLDAQASLCFHHKHDKVLGKVLELTPDAKGLKTVARVDGAIATHPELGTYYRQIKNGTLNGMSIGGFFKRGIVNGKRKIIDMDWTELSVTGVPVHTGPRFSVVAGKALTSDINEVNAPDLGDELREEDIRNINFYIEELNSLFDRIAEAKNKRKSTN